MTTPHFAPPSPEVLARHAQLAPSAWVERFSHLLAPGARVLDVACGSGRHMRWLKERGGNPLGVDKDPEALAALKAQGYDVIVADLEVGAWPFEPESMDAVLVTHYLWRALWPHLKAVLKPNALVIYETFCLGHEAFGRPKNPDFLLQPGELLSVFGDFHIIAFEEGLERDPPRMLQRVVAQKPVPGKPRAASPLRSLE